MEVEEKSRYGLLEMGRFPEAATSEDMVEIEREEDLRESLNLRRSNEYLRRGSSPVGGCVERTSMSGSCIVVEWICRRSSSRLLEDASLTASYEIWCQKG